VTVLKSKPKPQF